MTTAERRLLHRITTGVFTEEMIRWLLRQPGQSRLVRVMLRRQLQAQVQARFRQTRSRFSWPELLQKAYGVSGVLSFDEAKAQGIVPVTTWVPPKEAPWLEAQRRSFTGAGNASIVAMPDTPMACLCVVPNNDVVTSVLVAKRPHRPPIETRAQLQHAEEEGWPSEPEESEGACVVEAGRIESLDMPRLSGGNLGDFPGGDGEPPGPHGHRGAGSGGGELWPESGAVGVQAPERRQGPGPLGVGGHGDRAS
jgi:hypothetical protein